MHASAAALGAALRPAAPVAPLEVVELADDAPAASVRDVSAVGHALQSLRQVARLAQFTQLRSLVLHGGPLRSLDGLQACAASLEELNLSGNELGVIAALGHLPKLRALNVVRVRRATRPHAGARGVVTAARAVRCADRVRHAPSNAGEQPPARAVRPRGPSVTHAAQRGAQRAHQLGRPFRRAFASGDAFVSRRKG